jgi:hypothetical protein
MKFISRASARVDYSTYMHDDEEGKVEFEDNSMPHPNGDQRHSPPSVANSMAVSDYSFKVANNSK